jgi:hypothetical protein
VLGEFERDRVWNGDGSPRPRGLRCAVDQSTRLGDPLLDADAVTRQVKPIDTERDEGGPAEGRVSGDEYEGAVAIRHRVDEALELLCR